MQKLEIVVVVLCNGKVFGVWSLLNELSVSKKNDIRHAIKEKVKSVDTEDVFTVEFSDTYVADYSDEVLDEILETIDNAY